MLRYGKAAIEPREIDHLNVSKHRDDVLQLVIGENRVTRVVLGGRDAGSLR